MARGKEAIENGVVWKVSVDRLNSLERLMDEQEEIEFRLGSDDSDRCGG
jgi:hypothetical protein